MSDRLEYVRAVYDAFASGDRSVIEASFTEDFRFSSPLDVDLDRAGYFERCWPGSGRGQEFEFVRLIESGDEVVVTYETTRPDKGKGRNTEILTFRGNHVCRTEVTSAGRCNEPAGYCWELAPSASWSVLKRRTRMRRP